MKILIGSIVILIFLNLSCISAVDDNSSLELKSNISNDNFESIESDIDNILNTKHSLNDGSFNDIQNLIDEADSGDTIVLNGKFVAEDESSTILINKKLTITSSDNATLDGNGKSRIFHVKSNAEGLIINNIIFKNALTTSIGGGIYLNAHNVTIDNCTFHNCAARSGGAIAVSDNNGDNLTIKNSNFYSNHGSSFAGAVIYMSKNLEMTSCIFDSNYIKLNQSMGGGGALQIGLENEDNNCRITDCIFNNNYVTSFDDNNGHASVACLRRGVTFTSCNFTNNSAYDAGVLGFHDGGSVINCQFFNNYIIECGGALKFDITNQTVLVENSYFENNTAKNGGAIYFFDSQGTINNCIFVNNSAENGGAIYSKYQLNIGNCTFKSNHALNDGGAIYNNNILSIQDSFFINNHANNNGGAVYNLGTFNSKNCQYQTNRAKSMLNVSSNSPVKCSDNAIVKAVFEGGNNIINAIWSQNSITLDDKTVNPNNKIPSQNIILKIEDKIFKAVTNDNGEAIFKFNTINLKLKITTVQYLFMSQMIILNVLLISI